MEIRRLQKSDARALDEFLRNGLSEESKKRFGAHRPDVQSCEDVCNAIGTDGTIRIVAVDDGKIAGYLILAPLRQKEIDHYAEYGRSDLMENTLILAPAVADAYQRHGIGRELVEYAILTARERGVDTIVLWGGTHDDNSKARAFYERIGFEYIGTFTRPDETMLNHDMALSIKEAEK